MPAPRRSSSPGSGPDYEPSETSPLLASAGALLADPDTEASTLVGSTAAGSPAGSDAGDPSSSGATVVSSGGKPLPKLQIILLCYARMTEPIAFFCIFPFIAQMVARNGHIPDTDVGLYSGLIESLFSATQMCVLVSWGKLADRIGRKPVLLYSLAGTAIAPALFCLSTTLLQMYVFRSIAGALAGSNLIIRTMIAEHSTPQTQARAFSWFAFGGNVGLFLGPIIGGVLADPAEQYPGVFGGIKFFEDYPYALPGFVTAAISATGFIANALFLTETLEKPNSDQTEAQSVAPQPSLSTWELLKAPGVGVVLWIYGHVMVLAFAFTAIVPVFLFTPIDRGGAGMSPSEISLFMALQGASQAAWLLLAFPPLQHRYGTKGIMKACGTAYPFFFVFYIVLNLLLRDGGTVAMRWFWILAPIVAILGPGISMAFIGVQLALNDVSPSSNVLGTLNALALTFSSAIRTIVPGAATAIYAVGVRGNILGGHLAWVILTPLAVAFAIGCRYLPEDSQSPKDDNDEED